MYLTEPPKFFGSIPPSYSLSPPCMPWYWVAGLNQQCIQIYLFSLQAEDNITNSRPTVAIDTIHPCDFRFRKTYFVYRIFIIELLPKKQQRSYSPHSSPLPLKFIS